MENELLCGSQNYCWLVGDQILISCKNMIINLLNVYDVVILDFFVICDLSLNVKMYLWLKLYTVPFFVSGQIYKISKGSNNYCSQCIWNTHGTHTGTCAHTLWHPGQGSRLHGKGESTQMLAQEAGTGNTGSVLSSGTNCQFRIMASGSSGGAAPWTAEDCRGEWKTTAQLKGVRLMAAGPL